jgi:hypothetical protein
VWLWRLTKAMPSPLAITVRKAKRLPDGTVIHVYQPIG